jgi:hypothetical protein
MRSNLQENASNKGYNVPIGAQSQSKISMKQADAGGTLSNGGGIQHSTGLSKHNPRDL